MSMTTDELIRIVSAGASVTLDVGTRTKDELVTIAGAAADSEVLVTFRNLGEMAVDDLVEIAKAGDGSVTFEF
ncbi:MAG: hypothetical protein JSV60_03420 [Desulfobacterales bacterium]|jgi:hypothetical protein|nr:MAG: hypothetical protein JSV60_03420 [Desulfobacterales bacterium]